MESQASSSGLSASKKKDFNARFRDLHKLRQKARKENHEQVNIYFSLEIQEVPIFQVVEEDRRSKLPKNHEAKKEREQWQVKELEDRKAAEDNGLEYER